MSQKYNAPAGGPPAYDGSGPAAPPQAHVPAQPQLESQYQNQAGGNPVYGHNSQATYGANNGMQQGNSDAHQAGYYAPEPQMGYLPPQQQQPYYGMSLFSLTIAILRPICSFLSHGILWAKSRETGDKI